MMDQLPIRLRTLHWACCCCGRQSASPNLREYRQHHKTTFKQKTAPDRSNLTDVDEVSPFESIWAWRAWHAWPGKEREWLQACSQRIFCCASAQEWIVRSSEASEHRSHVGWARARSSCPVSGSRQFEKAAQTLAASQPRSAQCRQSKLLSCSTT